MRREVTNERMTKRRVKTVRRCHETPFSVGGTNVAYDRNENMAEDNKNAEKFPSRIRIHFRG